MDDIDDSLPIEDCISCFGEVRKATPEEIQACLETIDPRIRAAREQPGGTWIICPRCGIPSVGRWDTVDWDDLEGEDEEGDPLEQ